MENRNRIRESMEPKMRVWMEEQSRPTVRKNGIDDCMCMCMGTETTHTKLTAWSPIIVKNNLFLLCLMPLAECVCVCMCECVSTNSFVRVAVLKQSFSGAHSLVPTELNQTNFQQYNSNNITNSRAAVAVLMFWSKYINENGVQKMAPWKIEWVCMKWAKKSVNISEWASVLYSFGSR